MSELRGKVTNEVPPVLPKAKGSLRRLRAWDRLLLSISTCFFVPYTWRVESEVGAYIQDGLQLAACRTLTRWKRSCG